MSPVRSTLLGGAAAVACAVLAATPAAHASAPQTHVLTIQLPDGGSEQIRYTGDTPPEVVLVPAGAVGNVLVSRNPSLAPVLMPDPLAVFDRVSAALDREAATMLQQVATMARQGLPGPGSLTEAAFGRMPSGSTGYSVISTFSGGGACTRSTEIIAMGAGQQPRVVSHASGDCGRVTSNDVPAALPGAPVPEHRPGLIRVKYDPAGAVRSHTPATMSKTVFHD